MGRPGDWAEGNGVQGHWKMRLISEKAQVGNRFGGPQVWGPWVLWPSAHGRRGLSWKQELVGKAVAEMS